MLALLLACAPVSTRPISLTPPLVSVAAATPPLHAAPSTPQAPSGLTYEVYVRSFQDSDGDGIGDLPGLQSRLPYLQDLGVQTLWLMPLFPAFGPAGYDVTDFSTLHAAYGSPTDLGLLVADAHARGMKVLIDLPLNHVHRSHPWFQAAESGDSVWAVHRTDAADGVTWFTSARGGSYYAKFGAEMPDLDWERTEVVDAMVEVMGEWLEAGADGYRLDAVLMLVEEGEVTEGTASSHVLLAGLRARLQAAHPGVRFLAEASEHDVARSISWLGTSDIPEADDVLDFPRNDLWEDIYADPDRAVPELRAVIQAQVDVGVDLQMASFLGSHDQDRLATRIPDPAARRALMVAHLLLPGSPVLYYGEELDLADATSGTGQDLANRAPMPWDTSNEAGFSNGPAWFTADPGYLQGLNVQAELAMAGSMLQLVRDLGCVRSRLDLATTEGWEPRRSAPAVLDFVRETPAGALRVTINLSGEPQRVGRETLGPWAYTLDVPREASACGGGLVSLP